MLTKGNVKIGLETRFGPDWPGVRCGAKTKAGGKCQRPAVKRTGRPIPNPLLSIIDTLERQQLVVIRSMSLNQMASDPRTINGSAKVEGEARAALRDVGVEGLIAQPAH